MTHPTQGYSLCLCSNTWFPAPGLNMNNLSFKPTTLFYLVYFEFHFHCIAGFFVFIMQFLFLFVFFNQFILYFVLVKFDNIADSVLEKITDPKWGYVLSILISLEILVKSFYYITKIESWWQFRNYVNYVWMSWKWNILHLIYVKVAVNPLFLGWKKDQKNFHSWFVKIYG